MAMLARLVLRPDQVIYLANLAAVVTLMCGLGLLVTRLCRRCSVPLRHGVLTSVLALILLSPGSVWLGQHKGLGLIPVAVSLGKAAGQADASSAAAHPYAPPPGSEVFPARPPGERRGSVPAAASSPSGVDSSRPPATGLPTVGTVSSEVLARTAKPFASAAPSGSGQSLWWQVLGTLAAYTWAAGILVGVLRLAWGYALLIRIRSSLRRPDPRVAGLGRQVAGGMGLRELPPVYVSPLVPVPLSLGLARLAIVLPAELAARMEETQLEAILVHEMAHLIRRDPWMGLAQRLALVVFWWNPLVRRVSNQISTLREDLCDNYVVRAQGSGLPFARTLLDVASHVTVHPGLPATVGILEPNLDGLTERVHRLLGKERDMATRMSFGSTVLIVTCGLILLLATGLVRCLQAAEVATAATAQISKEDTKSPALAAGPDTIVDPQTGAKFVLVKTVSGANNIIEHCNKVTMSPDGRFLLWRGRAVPLDGTEAFWNGAGSEVAVSPNGRYLVHGKDRAVWVQPVSPETLRPNGPAKKLLDLKEGERWVETRARSEALRWTRDSEIVFFRTGDAEGQYKQHAFSAATGAPVNFPDATARGLRSPDGRCVALTDANDGFWVQPVGESAARRLCAGEAGTLCWSADGHWLIGVQVDDRIVRFVQYPEGREYVVPVPYDLPRTSHYVGPSGDRNQLFFYQPGYQLKMRIKVVSAENTPLMNVDAKTLYAFFDNFQWAPDGKTIFSPLYAVRGEGGLIACPLSGEESTRFAISPAISGIITPFAVSPNGNRLLFAVARQPDTGMFDLAVAPLSLANHEVSGPATVVFRNARAPQNVRAWLRPSEGTHVLAWSPDSTRVALISRERLAEEKGIWIAFTDGRAPLRLAGTTGKERDLQWSPDASMLAFISNMADTVELKIVSSSGGAPTVLRTWADANEPPWAWSPDSKSLTIAEKDMLVRQPLSGGKAESIANLKESGVEQPWRLIWSPDGRRLALTCDKPGNKDLRVWGQLVLARIEGSRLQTTATADLRGGNWEYTWSPDSTRVAYTCEDAVAVRSAGRLYALAVDDILEKINAGAIAPTGQQAATAAAEKPPTETAPVPAAEPIVGPVFSDNFDNGLSKCWWTPDLRSDPQTSPFPRDRAIENGQFMLQYSGIQLRQIEWTDYVETVRFCLKEAAPSGESVFGFHARHTLDNTGKVNGGYSLLVTCLDGVPSGLYLGLVGPSNLASSPCVIVRDKWYTLEFEVRGRQLRGYLDGKLMVEATDDRWAKGGISLFCWRSRALFDDFSVRQLP